MSKQKRDEKGRFVSQGENKFNSETGKETAEKHSWSNRRKQTLKRFGLLEENE